MSFALVGATPATDLAELQNWLDAARKVKLSGWTPFLRMNVEGWEPYPYEDFVEAWIGRPVERSMWNDPFHADFWRASLDGELYTIRGYAYDGQEALERGHLPGKLFDVGMPIDKIADGILFASRFAEEFTGVEQITIRCKFTGLSGRSLVPANAYARRMWEQYTCQTPELVLTKQVTLQQIRDNLPKVVHGILSPLFEKFGFYSLELNQIQSSLRQMRRYS